MSELRRELGLRDISLFAIACIVGTRWIASAAHTQGQAQSCFGFSRRSCSSSPSQ
jgi:hypothetical protein